MLYHSTVIGGTRRHTHTQRNDRTTRTTNVIANKICTWVPL